MNYLDIKTPEELYLYVLENIKYGFVSRKDGSKYIRKTFKNFNQYKDLLFKEYFFQQPENLLKNKCGLCWDQTELMKYWLINNNYVVKQYFSDFHNHSFLIYKNNDTFYLLDPALKNKYQGSNIIDLFNAYKDSQIEASEINLYEYNNINYGCDFYDFIISAKKSKNIIKLKKN